MLVDYKKRCLVMRSDYNLYIRYGMQAKDVTDNNVFEARDLDAPYKSLLRGGRRPGQPERVRQHFFNKRIMTDDERIGGLPSLRGANHRDALQAQDARGGVDGAGATAFPATVTGSGAGGAAADTSDAGEVTCAEESKPEAEEGNQEEVT